MSAIILVLLIALLLFGGVVVLILRAIWNRIKHAVGASDPDANYKRAKKLSEPLRIVKGDSKEVREQKKAERVKVWQEYDRLQNKARDEENFKRAKAYGEDFFRDLRQERFWVYLGPLFRFRDLV